MQTSWRDPDIYFSFHKTACLVPYQLGRDEITLNYLFSLASHRELSRYGTRPMEQHASPMRRLGFYKQKMENL
jgi:hypothetical protein